MSEVAENAENEQQSPANNGKFRTYKVSWVGYVKPGAITAIPLLLSLGFLFEGNFLSSFITLLLALYPAYYTYFVSSIRLYTNADGVWCKRGLLPWDTGSFGIKWRDMEDAVYFMGFGAWLLKSHTVRIGHRFTKTSEIIVKNLANAEDAVTHINSLHREMIEQGLT